ncbi:MAG: alkaline phosphatase family protein [Myxococcota bacterium]
MKTALLLLTALPIALVAYLDLHNPFFNDLPWLALLPLSIAVMLRDRHGGAFAALALVWFWTSRDPGEPPPAKVVVYGVDGATFDVLDAHAAELPHFAALSREGARATLTSMEPMFSPLLWTTMASGRPPEEHGVRGFHVQAPDCRVARFWDVAESRGRRIGLYKWLVDYPPREVPGFWVPSWLAPGPETWPARLSAVKELELSRRMRRKQVAAARSSPELAWALAQVGVRLSTLARAVAWSVEERIARPAPDRANVAMQLLRGRIDRDVFVAQLYAERPDLATFTYYATDGLAHLYWDRPEHVVAAYRLADEVLGELRDRLAPDARLVVVSDHGFKAMDGTGEAGQFAPLTERLRDRATLALGAPVDVTRVGHKLTLSAPDAAAARAWLATLTDRAGAPFFRVEDTPGGTLGLTLADEAITGERLAADTVGGEPIAAYVALTDAYTGTHDARGVFLAAGEGVTPGALADLTLYDVAPTVLAAAGLPPCVEMRGTAAVWPAQPPVEGCDRLVLALRWLGGEAGVNEEQLRALGYVQ